MENPLRRQVHTAAITIWALLALLVIFFFPAVERTAGGLLTHSGDGVMIAEYPDKLRQNTIKRKSLYVEYSHIPRCLEQAIISVEDKRFLLHAGIDPIAVVRVLFEEFQNDHVDHGGSTITQQLVRIILNLPRKEQSTLAALASQLRIMEAAFIIEHDFSKQTILELYLNSVYFGRGATGAGAAAQAYFGTTLQKLNEGECIYLAGLPQAPTLFGTNPSGKRARTRYWHVIATMERNRYLTKKDTIALLDQQLFSSR